MSFIAVPKKGLMQVSKKTIQRLENLADRTGRTGQDIIRKAFKNGGDTEEVLIKYLEQEESKLS